MKIATSSTNGKRVCSTQLRNNCLGGFKVGGNCNNQQVVFKNIKYEEDDDEKVEDDDGGDAHEVDNNDPLHQRLDSSRLMTMTRMLVMTVKLMTLTILMMIIMIHSTRDLTPAGCHQVSSKWAPSKVGEPWIPGV